RRVQCVLWFDLYSLCVSLFFFFFFQAEDGIRDFHVTGVQTCALPICRVRLVFLWRARRPRRSRRGGLHPLGRPIQRLHLPRRSRSEERRVGKECRSRWSPDHKKKKSKRTRRHASIQRASTTQDWTRTT